MKKKQHLPVFLFFIFFSIFTLTSYTQENIVDTIQVSEIITPFEFEVGEAVNFPLQKPEPCGDINGDGKGDLIFSDYIADERTESLMDRVRKSIITTEPGYNPNPIIQYGKNIKGIGDWNGDGYDDVFDEISHAVFLGTPDGLSSDSIVLSVPTEQLKFAYYNDSNGGGMAKIFFTKYSGILNLSGLFIGMDTIPYILSDNFITSVDHCLFFEWDYDQDGESEIVICKQNYYPTDEYIMHFYSVDTINHDLINEYEREVDIIHEPSSSYTKTLSDINGDGLKDITYSYFESDSLFSFNIEVMFGMSEAPYFSEPVDILVDNTTRLFYNAGDFNGDGADDWYSICHNDSIVIYYGGENVASEGFQKHVYYTGGDESFLFPKSLGYIYSFELTSRDHRLLYYNEDDIADLFFYYWTFDENKQFDFVGTAVVLGGENPDFLNPILVGRNGEKSYSSESFGKSLLKIGDFNNDGYEDWGALATAGCYVNIYFGGPDKTLEPDIKIELPQTEFALSNDWSTGDINGDGWQDIIIHNGSESNTYFMRNFLDLRNEVFVFYGHPNMQGVYNYEDADVVFDDVSNTFRRYGENMEIIGDANGDGYDDIVIGGSSNNFRRELNVIYGGENVDFTHPDLNLFINGSYYGLFGYPLVSCGDINADGFADFVVGDPEMYSQNGVAWVYLGAEDNSFTRLKIENPGSGNSFGSLTAYNKGDYDGDGYNDLIFYEKGENTVFIYQGGLSFDTNYDYTLSDTLIDKVYRIDFIDGMNEAYSDISICYKKNNKLDIHVYQSGPIQDEKEDYVIKSLTMNYSPSIITDDFNLDGILDVYVSTPYEGNFGSRGGFISLYDTSKIIVSVPPSHKLNKEEFSIYPNPAKNTINFSYQTVGNQNVEIKIFNLLGVLEIAESRNGFNRNNDFYTVNTENLTSGIHFLEVRQGSQFEQKKFIIAK